MKNLSIHTFLFLAILTFSNLLAAQSPNNESTSINTIGDSIAVDTNKVYAVVEQMPSFPGGDPEMRKFIYENLRIPKIVDSLGLQGRAQVHFIVTKTGEIKKIDIQRDNSISEALAKVVELMPRWIPGRQKGKEVDVYFTITLQIHLKQ